MAKRKDNDAPAPRSETPIPRIAAPPRRCPTCDCTEHSPYEARLDVVLPYAGTTADGKPYDLVIKRRCRCANCGQAMVHTFHELTADWVRQQESEQENAAGEETCSVNEQIPDPATSG